MTYETGSERECADCGAMTTRRGSRRNVPLCMDCALKRMAETARQLNAKKGERYSAWVTGMFEWAAETVELQHNPHETEH